MERYVGVHGRRRVERVTEAIEASGATIVSAPKPSEAPFEYRVRSSDGEVLDLICYAFTANKYAQRGRPADEHRLQVKYGSDFRRPHSLFIDPDRAHVTLLFGVHEEMPLFIAADPAMHNPTWFSSSIEFKQADLAGAKSAGWHGWQRDRVAGGRRRIRREEEDLRTEVLVGFRPEQFMHYVLFERIATGMDPGERLLLADRIATELEEGRSPRDLLKLPAPTARPEDLASHPLLLQLGLTPNELLGIIGERFRLLAAVRGGVAEYHLGHLLEGIREIERVTRLDEDGQPDFRVEYRGRVLRIECKNVLRKPSEGKARVDFQKTRAAKNDSCSRYYSPDQFEILAACLHPKTGKWEFSFCATNTLDAHARCAGKLSERVFVGDSRWTTDLVALLSSAPLDLS